MGRNQFWQSLAVAVGLCALVGAPALFGDPAPPRVEDPGPPPETQNLLPSPETASADVLREIAKLRKQMGTNVLEGTLLDAPPQEAEAEFARGVRKALGLAEDKPIKDRAASAKTLPEIAKSLRAHGTHLDGIASELEELKQYDHADQLRETANQLRLIARQFQP